MDGNFGGHNPVSMWIEDLRNADNRAATKLWNHYFERLLESARYRLHPETRRVYDEEDAAQSAFKSFCVGMANGRFPDLGDRDCLWRLLLIITARKVSRRHRFDRQLRRDVRRNVANPFFIDGAIDAEDGDAPVVVSREPSPEFAVQFVDVCESFWSRLDDHALQQVASLRMEGLTDREIAQQLSCSRSTVQRRLEVIRRHWVALMEEDDE